MALPDLTPLRGEPADRPGTDELVMRFRLVQHRLRPAAVDITPDCATTDPEVFHPEHSSGLAVAPYRAEREALAICARCPLTDLCLVQDMREAPTVFQVQGVRAGLRQAERRALYVELGKEGLL